MYDTVVRDDDDRFVIVAVLGVNKVVVSTIFPMFLYSWTNKKNSLSSHLYEATKSLQKADSHFSKVTPISVPFV